MQNFDLVIYSFTFENLFSSLISDSPLQCTDLFIRFCFACLQGNIIKSSPLSVLQKLFDFTFIQSNFRSPLLSMHGYKTTER